jgi:pyruvate,orthophosphate dikinase
VPLVPARVTGELSVLMGWVDRLRRLGLRTNADTPADAKTARAFGAEGIGLCRTEHMFFEPERILAVRQMILAGDEAGRRAALEKILPMQRGDFEEIFRVMDGLPVTIRLLDPPLHEFLPKTDRDIEEVARALGVTPAALRKTNEAHHEANPMLGHRGCRLGITYPEITEMQARAIFEAAVQVAKKGIKVIPEVMIPLIGGVKELENQKQIVVKVAEEVLEKAVMKNLRYMVGTMIEIPRAALTAGTVAKEAEFFSFGTNDLTQTTMGLSRDDYTKFQKDYQDRKIFANDPFAVLDQEGVGQLVKLAVETGRKTRPELEVGICGEHGGEPSSVQFCYRIGMNYVSCSPYRVPIARLAAAQAAISGDKTETMRTA